MKDTDMRFSINSVSEEELAAYDQAFLGSVVSAINKILDGKDTGAGVSSEPWETTRRRLIRMVQGNA